MNIEVQLDSHINQDVHKEIKKNIINILSQKGFSISANSFTVSSIYSLDFGNKLFCLKYSIVIWRAKLAYKKQT